MMELFLNGVIYIFIGTFAGFMAGVLGIGGGVIVVPGLLFIFHANHIIPENISMHVAAGSSLAVMILTSQSSLRAHLKIGEVLWGVFNKLWPGIVLGTISGAIIAYYVPTHWLKFIFGLFLFLVAVKMALDVTVTRPVRFPPIWVHRLISYLIGLKSGLLGVGGGVLIIPYLTYCGVDGRKIAPISNLCTFTVATVGSIVFTIMGWEEMKSIAYATGYIYWPAVLCVAIPSSLVAPLGARLNYALPLTWLRYVFIVMLLITAMNMVIK